MSVKSVEGSATPRLAWRLLPGMFTVMSAFSLASAQPLPASFDPYSTVPAIASTGVILPGDDAVFACHALPGTDKALNLNDVLDLALCNNPQVKAALAGIRQRASAVGEARSTNWPTLAATVSLLKNSTAYQDLPDSNTSRTGKTTSLNLTWRLLDFGGRRANQDAASQLLLAAVAGHEAALQKMLSSVVRAYFEALSAKSMLDLKIETVRLTGATLSSARQRESKGVAATGDVLQAQTALLKEQLSEQRATSDYRKALAALVNAMGAAAGTPLVLSERVDDEGLAEPIRPAADWLNYAQTRHPAIASAQAQLADAQKRVVVARSEGLPSLDMSGTYYKNGSPSQGLATSQSAVTNIGVVLNVPIFDGFARTYKLRGTHAQVEQLEAQLQETLYQVQTQISQSHADAEAAHRNLAPSADLLMVAKWSVATSFRRYSKGVADIQELLNAQGVLSQASQERLRCLIDWRSARLQLLANSGLLGRSRAMSAGEDVFPIPVLKSP